MTAATCPDCDSRIDLGSAPRVDQTTTCPSCGAYLQVRRLSPIELDWAFDEDDDGYAYEMENDHDYYADGDDDYDD